MVKLFFQENVHIEMTSVNCCVVSRLVHLPIQLSHENFVWLRRDVASDNFRLSECLHTSPNIRKCNVITREIIGLYCSAVWNTLYLSIDEWNVYYAGNSSRSNKTSLYLHMLCNKLDIAYIYYINISTLL